MRFLYCGYDYMSCGNRICGSRIVNSRFLFRKTTDAQYRSYIHAIDYRRCTALAYQRQRLTRDGHQSHSHAHIEKGLGDKQQGQSHG